MTNSTLTTLASVSRAIKPITLELKITNTRSGKIKYTVTNIKNRTFKSKNISMLIES